MACYKTAGLRPGEKLSPDAAYLYGRFFIKTRVEETGAKNPQTMGLRLWCDVNDGYTFWFADTRDVQVIRVIPTRCRLGRVIFASGGGLAHKEHEPPAAWGRTMAFLPGRAYYMGDFFARGDLAVTHGYHSSRFDWLWEMNPAD